MTNQVSVRELLKTTPESLALKQLQVLKVYAIVRLRDMVEKIDRLDIEAARNMVADSPAGDDHGLDNRFITFPELDEASGMGHGAVSADIGTVLDRLEGLKKLSQQK